MQTAYDITASPLSWPLTWPRTDPGLRQRSSFDVHTLSASAAELQAEVRRMRGRDLVISTNLRVRGDGLPYSGQRTPDDPGVAVYFSWKSQPIVFACDKWLKVEDNLWAIVKHIEALRGQERWGVGSLDQAFSGYLALPGPGQTSVEEWWSILGIMPDATRDEIKSAYREQAKIHHPDSGGNRADFDRLSAAYIAALAARRE